MNRLVALPLLIFMLGMGGQTVITGHQRTALVSASCTTPTLTYDYQFWNTGNYCTSGTTACTNGLGIYKLQDIVSGDTATQATGGNQPIYTTGQINSLAAGVFTSSDNMQLNLATGIPASLTISMFAVYNTPTGGSNETFIGSSTSGTDPSWFQEGGNFYVNIGASGIDAFSGLPTSGWASSGWQWNTTTGVWSIWKFSGGTATVVASGTTAVTPDANLFNQIGMSGFLGAPLNTGMAELGILSGSLNASATATYVSCKYRL